MFGAVKFDYGDESEWAAYFQNDIKKLAKSCLVIKKFWDELKIRCDGKALKDLQDEFDYIPILLGGVTPDGKYTENSLAKVYATLLGFKPENIHDLVERFKRGLPVTTKIVVRKTDFINFIENILDVVISILKQAENKGVIMDSNIDVRVDYFAVLSNHQKLIEILESFVNYVAKILPNYNQKSLFVWTLSKLTYKYMISAYPMLENGAIFERIKSILGLDIIFSPKVEDDSIKRLYEVYSYCDDSIGKELIRLFKSVWNYFSYFSRDLKIVFPELPNFKNEFHELAMNSLKSIGWELPHYIVIVGQTTSYRHHMGLLTVEIRKAEYRISGIIVTECYLEYYNRSTQIVTTRYYYETKEVGKSIFDFLDDISPMLFLLDGLEYNVVIREDYIEIIEISDSILTV